VAKEPEHDGESGSARTVSEADTILGLDSAEADSPEVDEELGFERRYDMRELLGEGGMGVVQLQRDRLIGRDIAMKLMHPEIAGRPLARERFLREARLQGRLEHPAVVPVHDLGITPNGKTYFTMKRVRGVALDQILDGNRARSSHAIGQVEQRRLLTAFSQICLAVDFAHERGVVHRDLKPANIMLGDFGEAYVLDWGVATDMDAEPESHPSPVLPSGSVKTEAGAVVGTAGFIAPEIIALGAEAASRQSDVYALGAILHEIITLKPFIAEDDPTKMLIAALDEPQLSPIAAAPDRDVPPELDAICKQATAREAADRHGSVRELHDELEAYLAGDRDRELRSRAAQRHAVAARQAAVEALSSGDIALREQAMREVGRALALDPNNRAAMRTLVRLMREPPEEIPAGAQKLLEREQAKRVRSVSKMGSLAYVGMLMHAPLVIWMGIQDWTWFLIGGGAAAVAGVLCGVGGVLDPPSRMLQHFVWASGAFSIAVLSLIFGPLVLVPGMLIIQVITLTLISKPSDRRVYLALTCAALIVPWLLQLGGWIPASYDLSDGTLRILPNLTRFDPTSTMAFLLASGLAQIILAAMLVGTVRRLLDRTQQRIHVRAWHLENLMPEDALADVPLSSINPRVDELGSD